MKMKLEIGFIVIIITVFAIIVISGVAINSKLSASIEEINQQHHQDAKIKLVKDVSQQLIEAENLVYSFNLTKNNGYLKSYYSVNSSTFRKINKLYNITQKDTFYTPLVDSVNLYAKAKIKNLSRILILQNQYRVNEAMTLIENEANKIKQIRESESKNAKKKKFSLFRKSSKDKNQSSSDALINRNAEIYNFQNELKEIKNFESSKERKNNAEEFTLMQENRTLMQKFNRILQTLDKKEKLHFIEKQKNSKNASLEVKLIVLIFSILSTILLLFAVYIIFQYIIKNNKYKKHLREAKIQSEELAASKARFLSNMSHEIRTPLNAIIGFSDLLEKNAGNSSKEVRDQIEIINKSSKHLSKIINEVLDFSKLESKKMVVQELEFDPSAEVSEVIEILSASAQEKNNQLEFKLCSDLPDVLYGDQLKLKQILFNLIGNAIKFTENGKISCEQIETEKQDDSYLFKMSIIDTGIGISKASLSKIFHEFVQDDNKSYNEKTGTGLGLSITKLLLEALGGKIDVESEEGVGAVFTFEIPFKLSSDEEGQISEKHKKIDLSHKHILIVDDEKYNRKLIVALLKNSDALIFEAENGKVALDILKEKEIDLVFLDLKMPVMDGYEFMEKFKVSKHSDDVKIIALTALELETKAEKELFDDFILKPINGEVLIQKLHSAFRIKIPVNSTKKTEEISSSSPYNLEQLKSISNGDSVFYKDMVSTLIDTSQKGVLDLKIAFNANDLGAISETAHKMSSPFKHINALGIYSLLKQLERDSKTMDIKILEELILKTEQEIDKLIELLNKEL